MLSLLVALPGVFGSTTCLIKWAGELLTQKPSFEVMIPDIFCDITAYPDSASIAARMLEDLTFSTSSDCSELTLGVILLQLSSAVVAVRADERICISPPADLVLVYRNLVLYAGQQLYTPVTSAILQFIAGDTGNMDPLCALQWFGEYLAQKTEVEVFLPDVFCDLIAFPDNVSIATRALQDLTFLTSPKCPQSDLETFWLQFVINIVNLRHESICNPPPTDLFVVYLDLYVLHGQDLIASGTSALVDFLAPHDHSAHACHDDYHYADGHTHESDKSFAFETSVLVSLVALAIRVL